MFERIVLPALLGVASAIATICMRVLSDSFAEDTLGAQVATYTAGLISIANAGIAMVNGIEASRDKVAADAYTALLAALTKVVDHAKVPAADVGLSAYRVATKWRTPFCVRLWPLRTPWYKRQQRVARVRLSNDPPRCTIEWVEQKGVVGQCWQAKDRCAYFFRRDSSYIGCTREDWASAPDDTVIGLTFDEWVTTQRYAFIIARPIQNRDEAYIGCVSLDTTKEEHVDKLNAEKVRELLGDAALAVGKSIGGA